MSIIRRKPVVIPRRRNRRGVGAHTKNAIRYGRAVGFRYRAESWPIVVLGVLFIARGVAMRLEPRSVLVLSLLGAAAVLFKIRRSLNRDHEWWYAAGCLTACVMGLTLTSLWGGGHPVVNMMCATMWASAAGVWWWHHRARGVPRPVSVEMLIGLWNKNVRKTGKALPGAKMTDVVPFEHGSSCTVELVEGEQTLAMAMSALPRIASGLRTPMHKLIFENYPGQEDPNILRLQHITTSPIEETVWFDEPRYADGHVLVGPYADGIGDIMVPIYTENSVKSLLVIGGTGVGKSALVNTIVLTIMDPGFPPTVVWYADGQDGASSPTLFKKADWAVRKDKFGVMLSAAERIADRRNKENTAWGIEGFEPTEDRPGLIIVMDEFHEYGPKYEERLRNAATSWRKVGIGFVTLDQDANLKVFGGNDALRAALMSGGAIMMRVNSRITGNLIPGCPINPYDLPDLPGYLVRVAAAQSAGRTAPGRSRYAPDRKSKAKAEAKGQRVPVQTIEERFDALTPRGFVGAEATIAGSDYTDRGEIAAREREELLAWLNDPTRATAPVVVATGPDQDDDSGSTADAILALPWGEHPGGLSVQDIVRLLGEGGVRPSPSTITKALKVLRERVERGERGLVQDGPRQPYRLADRAGVGV